MAAFSSRMVHRYLILTNFVMSLCLVTCTYRQPSKKIFFIGYPKTGTSALTTLTNSLGWHTCHENRWATASKSGQTIYFTRKRASCEAFSDGEEPAFEWLDKAFPGSAFVLNTRPLESWLVSGNAFFKMLRAVRYARVPEASLKPKLRTKAPDVWRWIVRRDAYHTRVLRYFAPKLSTTHANESSATGQPGLQMAPTGMIYRRDDPRNPAHPPTFFMIVDIHTDGDVKVKGQLMSLLKVSGLEKRASSKSDTSKGVGLVMPDGFATLPENVEKAKKCVSGVLDEIGLTLEERASNLLIGHPVPPLRADYDGSSCIYKVIITKNI
eukprot:jgi/Mesvir1/26166/Mv06864-RA.1